LLKNIILFNAENKNEVKNMLVVCAAIIHKDNKVLIAQRKEGDTHALLWEFPGGKVEEGESPEESIVREINEELDINISADNVFDVVHHKYEKRNIILIVYNCTYLSGDPKAIECNDFKWIDIKEMNKFKFVAADNNIVNKLNNLL
jgi:8-oxo-dGTP diphosphatase